MWTKHKQLWRQLAIRRSRATNWLAARGKGGSWKEEFDRAECT